MTGDTTEMRQSRFFWASAAIVVLALALRLLYVFGAKVDAPIVGDINQYVLYGWNLVHGDVFSSSLPNAGPVRGDDYRGPGYPALIAASMLASGNSDLALVPVAGGQLQLVAMNARWIVDVYVVQAMLGAITVLLTIAIARFWLGRRMALAAGVLTALWPHLISLSGVLLSETLFGFMLALAAWLLALAVRDRRPWVAAGAGLAFAGAYLVNPVIGLFPLFLGLLMVAARMPRRMIAILMVCYLIAPLGWAARSASLPRAGGSYERAVQNLVQGSWPEFLDAFNARHTQSAAAAFVQAEQDEERAFLGDARVGLQSMWMRMREHPAAYLAWYIAKKPYLLWDWSIRVGYGDIYFLTTTESPYTRITALRWMKQGFELANPSFFVLSALAAFCLAWTLARHRGRPPSPEGLVAFMLLYLTAVHVVLQAEPRYSIPYRPEQMLMVTTAVNWLLRAVMGRTRVSAGVIPTGCAQSAESGVQMR